MSEQIHIGWMYPDILNLHGDRGNLQAISHVAQQMGLEAVIRKVDNPGDEFDLEQTDLLVFNPGELKVCAKIAQALEPRRKALDAYLNAGKLILVIGTSGTIFGGHVERWGAESFDGLGYLDVSAKERKMILGDDLYCRLPDGMELMGSQVQMAEYTVGAGQALAKVEYGRGNCGDGTEGARVGGLIWTNLLGPVMMKNPWWAYALLEQICKAKGIEYTPLSAEAFRLENASLEACKAYIELKKEHKD